MVDLTREELSLRLDRDLLVLISLKICIRHVHLDDDVAEILHLLVPICLALWVHRIVDVAKLRVHVVAGDKIEFEALIVVIVFDAPDAQLSIVQVVPVEAE